MSQRDQYGSKLQRSNTSNVRSVANAFKQMGIGEPMDKLIEYVYFKQSLVHVYEVCCYFYICILKILTDKQNYLFIYREPDNPNDSEISREPKHFNRATKGYQSLR